MKLILTIEHPLKHDDELSHRAAMLVGRQPVEQGIARRGWVYGAWTFNWQTRSAAVDALMKAGMDERLHARLEARR